MRRHCRSGLISSHGSHNFISNSFNYEVGNWVASIEIMLMLFWGWLIESSEISFLLVFMQNLKLVQGVK
jgi:hypothetical protein